MSESLSMVFEIGGTIKKSDIKKFLEALDDDCYEYTGPATESEFLLTVKTGAKGNTIEWNAMSNYGECDDLKDFCKEHNIAYLHTCEPSTEFDGYVKYWLPGMKEEICHTADHGGDAVADVATVRSVVDLLMAVARRGPKALMEFVGVESVKSLVEQCLKKAKPDQNDWIHVALVLDLIEKRLNELLPVVPALPPLIVK